MSIGVDEKPAQILPHGSIAVLSRHDAGLVGVPHVPIHRALQILDSLFHIVALVPQHILDSGQSTSVNLYAPVANVTLHDGLLALERSLACAVTLELALRACSEFLGGEGKDTPVISTHSPQACLISRCNACAS